MPRPSLEQLEHEIEQLRLKFDSQSQPQQPKFPWQNVVVSVLAAGLIGFFGLIVGAASDGRLVHWMGAVTEQSLPDDLKNIVTENPSLRHVLVGEQDLLAKGMIVASSGECNSLGSGWSNYTEAGGRFILAAGQGTDDDQPPHSESFISPKKGGKYLHRLTRDELPRESLKLPGRFVELNLNPKVRDLVLRDNQDGATDDLETTDSATTEPLGNGVPYLNLPPYIVLTLCKKE